jgi:hypothetical protein
MLSPTRSSAQTVLKAVVTTASTILQESASTSVEQKEESNDADDNEPVKKKFKDDTETDVNIEIFSKLILFFYYLGRNFEYTNNSSSNTTTKKTKSLCFIWLLWYVLKFNNNSLNYLFYLGAGYFGLQR